MTIEDLVFQGGGVKGVAYVGAIAELDRRDALAGVTTVAGTSAGANTAAPLAVGAGAEEVSRAQR
ncbi:patatin-like phospholipase family protein [Sorangium sp. So ce394]|uniref:patatin-like phospholipase family protein n=1 Tax=Sorangium sp. So ce394 TaxID=3133310 RepID=UPI003F5BD57D